MSSRRRFGRVRRLPSGRWQARYPDGSGEDVPAPETFASKGDAARWLVMVEADMARGQYVDPRAGRITFGEWAKEWLGRPGKRANSIARDRQGLEAFTAHLGFRPLASITPMHVQSAVDERGHHCSPATLARDLAAVRAVFNAAVDADLIARSPARKVALPKVRPPERTPLTAEELLRLADAIDGRYRALVLVGGVLGFDGARRSRSGCATSTSCAGPSESPKRSRKSPARSRSCPARRRPPAASGRSRRLRF
jgi:hypothetical protein